MWLCDSHNLENKDQLEKYVESWRRSGGKFVYTATVPSISTTTNTRLSLEDITEVTRVEGEKDISSELEDYVPPTYNAELDPKTVASCDAKVCSTLAEATKMLREEVSGSVVQEVPEGEPLFMFSSAVGKTRPLNVFYDNGCSHVCFRYGVPTSQLTSRLTHPGPIYVHGVGGTIVKMNSEYVVLLDRAEGTKQALQGVEALDPITTNFPKVKLTDAIREIKSSDPNNLDLQGLRVPEQVGGDEVDILLGIHYECVHPVPVHRLVSGLTIYKLQLASYGGLHDAVLGGPHETFRQLADKAGSPATLLAHFIDGLTQYRQLGPPRVSCNPMTLEEMEYAASYNSVELEHIAKVVDTLSVDHDNMKVYMTDFNIEPLTSAEMFHETPVDNIQPRPRLLTDTRGHLLSTANTTLDTSLDTTLDFTLDNDTVSTPCYRAGCSPWPQGVIEQPCQVNCRSMTVTSQLAPSNVSNKKVLPGEVGVPGVEIAGDQADPPSTVGQTHVPVTDPVKDDCALPICNKCGVDYFNDQEGLTDDLQYLAMVSSVALPTPLVMGDNEDLRDLKLLLQLQEEGLSVEYRSPRCRHCVDCRNSPTTERVSLREEAEDQAVKDSISIDYDSKKITCSLPLRGKAEDFLSNNRDTALKILDQQCKKYFKDENTKNTVVKAFQKLFEHGYACLFSQLTPAQKQKILEKPI